MEFSDDLVLDWVNFSYFNPDLDAYNEKFKKHYSQLDYFFEKVCPEFKDVPFFKEYDTGYHYDHGFCYCSDVCIYFDMDGSERHQDKGILVVVPSHGLEYFFTIMGCSSVKQMFTMMLQRGCRVSRIDICYDDYKKLINPDQFFIWFREGYFNTRLKHNSFSSSCPDDHGTFYLGNRAGLRMCRIYDKFFESTKKHQKNESVPILDCIRYEFEYHSYGATSFVDAFIASGKVAFKDVVNSFFKIVDPTASPQKCRCPLLDQWQHFLEELEFSEEHFVFKTKIPPPSYERSVKWFEKMCMKTYHRIIAHGEGWRFKRGPTSSDYKEIAKDDYEQSFYESTL